MKTNIGHTEAAAGIAGLIKVVLALEHKLLPPSCISRSQTLRLISRASPFYVNTELSEWKAGKHPRRAGVSSFGIGGTNAHVILEEAPERSRPSHTRSLAVADASAKTGSALAAMTENLIDHI